MAAAGIQSPTVLDELESHLREDVDKKTHSGLDPKEAFEAAAQQIGAAAALGSEFKKAQKARRSRLLKRCFFGVAAGFFVIAIFGYFVVVPLVVRANAQYAAWLGIPKAQPDVSFVCRLVFGLCFGLAIPAGIVVLASTGVLNQSKLASYRRHTIVANFIVAALLTTPEVATQILLFVPLQLLCELGILIAGIWQRRTQKSL